VGAVHPVRDDALRDRHPARREHDAPPGVLADDARDERHVVVPGRRREREHPRLQAAGERQLPALHDRRRRRRDERGAVPVRQPRRVQLHDALGLRGWRACSLYSNVVCDLRVPQTVNYYNGATAVGGN
jgi:hypothetical protein